MVFLAFILSLHVSAETIVKYPYYASPERSLLITTNYTEIKTGDSIDKVLKKLPSPDEVHDLYEPKVFRPNIIGKTYWYIIQRKAESGSVNEKDEKLVRVSFNLQEIVTKIDHWGF